MEWMGSYCHTEEQLHELGDYICNCFGRRYSEREIVPQKRCFVMGSGEVISVSCIDSIFCLVLEYAESVGNMSVYMADDVGLYSPKDYNTPDEMSVDMIKVLEEDK